MRILVIACLLLLESFSACKQNQEIPPPLQARAVFTSVPFELPSLENTTASNIIYRSVDGGKTWEDVSAGLPKDYYVACMYAGEGEVVLGSEKGLFRSDATTTGAPVWEKDYFCDNYISNISPGRRGPYYSSYGNGFFHEIGGTGIWTPLHMQLENRRIRTVMELPDDALLIGSDDGIFKSRDHGKSWKQVFDGGMILDIVASGNILIGGGRQGVVRSVDGGENWESVLYENVMSKKTGLIKGQFFTILGAEDISEPPFGGITNRLRTSSDGGKTWHRLEKAMLPVRDMYDMDACLQPARDLYDLVQVGSTLLCSFDTGIYRSNDFGKTWACVLPTTEKRRLANMVVSGTTVYAVMGGGC